MLCPSAGALLVRRRSHCVTAPYVPVRAANDEHRSGVMAGGAVAALVALVMGTYVRTLFPSVPVRPVHTANRGVWQRVECHGTRVASASHHVCHLCVSREATLGS